MFYSALSKGPFRVKGVHDKDSKRLFGIRFAPDAWVANTVYGLRNSDDYDIVIPTVFAGLYYKVTSPGKSGATEPTWNTVIGDETTDGTTGLTWEAVPYNLMPVSESINTVTYTTTFGVTLSSETNTDTTCQFMIEPLPDAAVDAGYFDITAHVIKSNSEELDITLRFTVYER